LLNFPCKPNHYC